MTTPKADHIVVYWGRRGGGLDLFNHFIDDCKHLGVSIVSSNRPTYRGRDGKPYPISFMNARAWFHARKLLLNQVSEGQYKTVVFIMSSPWDLFLGKKLLRKGAQVVRIIHDSQPHPGEKFPPNFWIKMLTKDCSRIVTLSNYVASQLIVHHGVDSQKILVCRFPIPKVTNKQSVKNAPPKKILLTGRGKKYQGQHLLEAAWDLLDKTDKELVIAGEGFKPNSKHPDIIYKNWWMTHEEMIGEISSSDLVVFPYTEASQSGTIPICRALEKPVVATPVGGLIEQVEHGVNGLVCEEVSKVKLAQSISDALKMNWSEGNFNTDLKTARLVEGCLLGGRRSSFEPNFKAEEKS